MSIILYALLCNELSNNFLTFKVDFKDPEYDNPSENCVFMLFSPPKRFDRLAVVASYSQASELEISFKRIPLGDNSNGGGASFRISVRVPLTALTRGG